MCAKPAPHTKEISEPGVRDSTSLNIEVCHHHCAGFTPARHRISHVAQIPALLAVSYRYRLHRKLSLLECVSVCPINASLSCSRSFRSANSLSLCLINVSLLCNRSSHSANSLSLCSINASLFCNSHPARPTPSHFIPSTPPSSATARLAWPTPFHSPSYSASSTPPSLVIARSAWPTPSPSPCDSLSRSANSVSLNV